MKIRFKSHPALIAAIAAGQKRFDGPPCVNCGGQERFVAGGACVACQDRKFRERLESNPEWNRQRTARYRERHPDRHRESTRNAQRKRRKCPDLRAKEAAACREWRANNPDKNRAAVRNWRLNNREADKAINAARRAREVGAEGRYTDADIARLAAAQGGLCAYCERPWQEVDHIIPLAHPVTPGSNWPSNLQLLCRSHNASKSNKTDFEYRAAMGWPAIGKPIELCHAR